MTAAPERSHEFEFWRGWRAPDEQREEWWSRGEVARRGMKYWDEWVTLYQPGGWSSGWHRQGQEYFEFQANVSIKLRQEDVEHSFSHKDSRKVQVPSAGPNDDEGQRLGMSRRWLQLQPFCICWRVEVTRCAKCARCTFFIACPLSSPNRCA